MIKGFGRNIIWVINLAIIAFLGLAMLSVKVSPEKFWPLAFFGLGMPYLIILNFLFFIYWVLKRKKYLVASFIMMIFSWNHLESYFQFTGKSAEGKDGITVLSYNIKLCNFFHPKKAPNGNRRNILKMMDNMDADIICIQEFSDNNIKKLGKTRVFKKHFSEYEFYSEPLFHNSINGMITFSKFPILKQEAIKFKQTANFITYVDLLVDKKDTLRVYNVHLQSIYVSRQEAEAFDSLAHFKSKQQMSTIKLFAEKLRNAFVRRAEQIERLVSHIEACPYRVIVCGDFNDPPGSYAYNTIKANLKDAFIEAGIGTSSTYIGKLPSFRIDYIFADPDIEVMDYQKMTVEASDHYPIWAKIGL